MRIQHNILAMNAYRNYNTNTSALAKNLEKLSSGYKINRAGDDAAGLAISEKMRAQITGLNAAQKNVKDGISLVKTAEGAMQEIQDMLNRMDYLATQSANGTYDNEVDRLNLQKEVDQLRSEINRIADSANFNGINLLDGSMQDGLKTTRTGETIDISNNLLTNVIDDETKVGTGMILKEAGVDTAVKTSVTANLQNLAIANAAAGSTAELTVGDVTLKLQVADPANNAQTAGAWNAAKDTYYVTADDLSDSTKMASAFAAAFNALADTTTPADGKNKLGGQLFTATASGTEVKFEQTAAPTHAGEVVDASLKVELTLATPAGTATNADLGIATQAEGDEAGASVSGTLSSTVTVGGKDAVAAEYTLVLTGKTADDVDGKKIDGIAISKGSESDLDAVMGAFVDTYNADSSKDYTASWDATSSTVTLTAKNGGVVSTAPTTDVSGNSADLTEKTPGAAAVTGKSVALSAANNDAILTAAGENTGKVTIKASGNNVALYVGDTKISEDLAFQKVANQKFLDADGNELLTADFSNIDAIGDLGTDAIETGLEVKSAGSNEPEQPSMTPSSDLLGGASLSNTLDFGNKSQTLDATDISELNSHFASLGGNTGKITIGGAAGIEVDMANLATGASTVGDLASKLFEAAKAAVSDYNKTADKKLEVVGVSSDQAGTTWLAGGVEGPGTQTITGGLYVQTREVADPPAAGDDTANGVKSGTYNVSTTKNVQGAAVGAARLASTQLKLDNSIIADGNTLTIGKNTYTFAVGKDSAYKGVANVIDLSAFETVSAEAIKKAGELLSNKDGVEFDLGFNQATGDLSIHEHKGQTTYGVDTLGNDKEFAKLIYANKAGAIVDGEALTFQIGDTSASYNQMKLSIGDMHTSAMGGKNSEGAFVSIADIDISNQTKAQEAIQTIKDAINYVSGVRGDLGATQNRLEHTANNLSVMAENIQDAESSIRDTDVAEEMMAYTKNNILVQSAQAMLAQANQVPQGVLQLLG